MNPSPNTLSERFAVVCGLSGPFHVVDRWSDGKGVASFPKWEDARRRADQLNRGELIILQFRALPSDVEAPIRVRHLLKRALRSYGLECVKVIGLPDSWDAFTPPEPAATIKPEEK